MASSETDLKKGVKAKFTKGRKVVKNVRRGFYALNVLVTTSPIWLTLLFICFIVLVVFALIGKFQDLKEDPKETALLIADMALECAGEVAKQIAELNFDSSVKEIFVDTNVSMCLIKTTAKRLGERSESD